MAFAHRTGHGWRVFGPQRVPPAGDFIERWLFEGRTVLAGFDFPIGVPAEFGKKTGFAGFVEALLAFGIGGWNQFFEVAERPEDISLRRPFYPHHAKRGCSHDELLRGLGFRTMDELRRTCELKTQDRRAACPVFWTLGGNQVGKAAIDGWRSSSAPLSSEEQVSGHSLVNSMRCQDQHSVYSARRIRRRHTAISVCASVPEAASVSSRIGELLAFR